MILDLNIISQKIDYFINKVQIKKDHIYMNSNLKLGKIYIKYTY